MVSLQLEQPRNLADDKILRRQSQFAAKFQIVFRGKKGFERKTAENFGVLLRSADAGGEILGFHCVGDDDEMGRGEGSVFLGGPKGKVGEAVLKIAEGGSVDRMDNDGYARAFRR